MEKVDYSILVQFAKDNLQECCRELVDWDNTGILCHIERDSAGVLYQGYVRELACMLGGWTDTQTLRVASGIISKVAMEKIVEDNQDGH